MPLQIVFSLFLALPAHAAGTSATLEQLETLSRSPALAPQVYDGDHGPSSSSFAIQIGTPPARGRQEQLGEEPPILLTPIVRIRPKEVTLESWASDRGRKIGRTWGTILGAAVGIGAGLALGGWLGVLVGLAIVGLGFLLGGIIVSAIARKMARQFKS